MNPQIVRDIFGRLIRIVAAALLIDASPCFADFATPFVETNNKVGDVSEAHAFISKCGPRYLVVVINDRDEPVCLWATADDGIIKDGMLGREIRVKASVTRAGERDHKPVIKIIGVEPLPAAAADDDPEHAILKSCRRHLRTLPDSHPLAALSRDLPHDRLEQFSIRQDGDDALALLAMPGGYERFPNDDVLWYFELRKADTRWEVNHVGQISTADEFVEIPAKFRRDHPDASGPTGVLQSQVSEKLLKTVHPDYRRMIGKWQVVEIKTQGDVSDFELHGLKPESGPGAECFFPMLQTPVGLLRVPDYDKDAQLAVVTFGIPLLNPAKERKQILCSAGKVSITLFRDGIYQFESNGDLTICINAKAGMNPGKDIPNDFELIGGENQVLLRLRRLDEEERKRQGAEANDGLDAMRRIYEFRNLHLKMSEAWFLEHLNQFGLASESAEENQTRHYVVVTRSGSNSRGAHVTVSFNAGVCVAIKLQQPSTERADRLYAEYDERTKEARSLYQDACKFFAEGGDTKEAIKRFSEAGTKAPIGPEFGRRSLGLAEQLERMSKEPAPVADPGTLEGRLDKLVHDLRLVRGRAMMVPGKVMIIGPTVAVEQTDGPDVGEAFLKLVENPETRAVTIKRLLQMLEDPRPTRMWAGPLNGSHFLRNGDAALQILANVTGRNFDARTNRDAYLWTASPELRKNIIDMATSEVRKWLAEQHDH